VASYKYLRENVINSAVDYAFEIAEDLVQDPKLPG